VLTGFGQDTIGNALSNFDYLQVLVDRAGQEATEALLAMYKQLKDAGNSDREIAFAILNLSDPSIAQLARTLMKLWYLGQWVQPYDYGPYKSGGVPVIVDPNAYTNSLAGRAAQAKPVGTTEQYSGPPDPSDPSKKGWAGIPPELSEFTG
jgi:hypothetical protein